MDDGGVGWRAGAGSHLDPLRRETRAAAAYDRSVDERAALSLLAFAEETASTLRGLDAKRALEQLAYAYEEVSSALGWLVENERADESLRLARALTLFWQATEHLDEGVGWLDRVLALPGGSDASRGHALFQAGLLAFWRGDDEGAAALHERALELGRRIGDPTVVALALGGLARIALRRDVDEAQRLCREALGVTEGTDDRAGRSGAIHVLAVAAQMAGDLTEARDLMNERIALAREQGNFAQISVESGNLSMVERQLGNLERAEELARDALEIDVRRGDAWALPYHLTTLAAVAVERGEHERAATLVGAAERLIADQGAEWPPDERVQYDWTVAALAERMDSAGVARARAAGARLSPREAVDDALRRYNSPLQAG